MEMIQKMSFTEDQVRAIYDEVERYSNQLREYAGLKDMEYLNARQNLCGGVRCVMKIVAYDYPLAKRLCEHQEEQRGFWSGDWLKNTTLRSNETGTPVGGEPTAKALKPKAKYVCRNDVLQAIMDLLPFGDAVDSAFNNGRYFASGEILGRLSNITPKEIEED